MLGWVGVGVVFAVVVRVGCVARANIIFGRWAWALDKVGCVIDLYVDGFFPSAGFGYRLSLYRVTGQLLNQSELRGNHASTKNLKPLRSCTQLPG